MWVVLPTPEVKSLIELQCEDEALNLELQRVELQREDEALKLKMFWEEHSIQKLNAALCRFQDSTYDMQCDFFEYFESELEEHDMSIGHDLPDPYLPIRAQRRVVFSDNNVLDDGHHFHNSARGDDWIRRHWTYGSKLLKATSVGDPELAKLERLFLSMRMIDF